MERLVSRGSGSNLGGSDENRLPWLDPVDDDRRGGRGGTGRFFAWFAFLLVVLALAAAAAWWFRLDQRLQRPDGSLIRAEAGPYKVRPDQPGGKTFPGTGDSAYSVSQGEVPDAALAEDGSEVADPGTAPAPDQTATPASAGVGVQLGAYADRTAAEAGWQTLLQRNPLLSGLPHRVVQSRADLGNVHRLQVVAGDLTAATALCRALRESGTDCYVKP